MFWLPRRTITVRSGSSASFRAPRALVRLAHSTGPISLHKDAPVRRNVRRTGRVLPFRSWAGYITTMFEFEFPTRTAPLPDPFRSAPGKLAENRR